MAAATCSETKTSNSCSSDRALPPGRRSGPQALRSPRRSRGAGRRATPPTRCRPTSTSPRDSSSLRHHLTRKQRPAGAQHVLRETMARGIGWGRIALVDVVGEGQHAAFPVEEGDVEVRVRESASAMIVWIDRKSSGRVPYRVGSLDPVDVISPAGDVVSPRPRAASARARPRATISPPPARGSHGREVENAHEAELRDASGPGSRTRTTYAALIETAGCQRHTHQVAPEGDRASACRPQHADGGDEVRRAGEEPAHTQTSEGALGPKARSELKRIREAPTASPSTVARQKTRLDASRRPASSQVPEQRQATWRVAGRHGSERQTCPCQLRRGA